MKRFFRLIAKIIAIIALIILIVVLVYAGQVGFAFEVAGYALSTWALFAGTALVIAFVISPRGATEGAQRVINGVEGAAKAVAKSLGAAFKGAGEGLGEGLGLKEIAKILGIVAGIGGTWWLLSKLGSDDDDGKVSGNVSELKGPKGERKGRTSPDGGALPHNYEAKLIEEVF